MRKLYYCGCVRWSLQRKNGPLFLREIIQLPRIFYHWPLIILWVITFVSIYEWYGKGNLIGFIDNFPLLGGLPFLKNSSFAWSNLFGFGSINITNYPQLPIYIYDAIVNTVIGLSPGIAQRIIYVTISIIAETGMYFLVFLISYKDMGLSRVAAITSSTFYFFNPVFLDLYWYFNFPGAVFVFAFLPLVLLFTIKSLNCARSNLRYFRFLLFAIFFITLTSISEVPYIFSVYIMLLITFFWFLIKYRRFALRIVRTFSITLIGSISLNAWWLFPLLLLTRPGISSIIGYNYNSNIIDLNINSHSATILNVLGLSYFPLSNGYAKWSSMYSTNILFSLIMPLFFVCMFLISYFIIFSKFKSILKVESSPFFISLPVFLFLLMGDNNQNPFSSLILYVFNHFFWLQAVLRGAYLSFGVAFGLSTSILFGISVAFVSRIISAKAKKQTRLLDFSPSDGRVNRFRNILKKSNKANAVAVVFILLSLSVIVGFSNEILTGANTNDLNLPATTFLPESYQGLSQLLQTFSQDNLTVVLPGSDGLIYENWPEPYFGSQILQFSSGSPVFQNVVASADSPDSLMYSLIGILPSYGTNLSYSNLLRAISAKYLIVDDYSKNQSYVFPFDFTNINRTVASQSGLSYYSKLNSYRIYSVNSPNKLVSSYSKWISANASITFDYNLSGEMGYLSSFNNTETFNGFNQMTVTNITNKSFSISLPNDLNNTESRLSGVINGRPLSLKIGQFPFIRINITTTGKVSPFFFLSSNNNVNSNLTAVAETNPQYVGAQLVSSSYNSTSGTTSDVFYLANLSGLYNSNYFLNYIGIILKPATNFDSNSNATISISAGIPDIMSNWFDPTVSAIIPSDVISKNILYLDNLFKESISFERINPVLYKVFLKPQRNENYALISLAQTFSSEWILRQSNNIKVLSHFPIDGILNGWLIAISPGATSFTIIYSLQTVSNIAEIISLFTFFFLISILILPAITKRHKST